MATDKDGSYTMKEYERSASDELTSSTEGCLEMIYRMEEKGGPIRVSSLAASLYVRPLSVSKILDSLKKAGHIDFKKYGSIMVTEKGYKGGGCLLHRHRVLQDFFCTLNRMEDGLELVEKTEHSINHKTVVNMEQALSFLQPKNGITGKMG